MAEEESFGLRRSGRIKDARGRRVAQLDPVALYLLRQHSVIGADVLRAIASKRGLKIEGKERVALILGMTGVLAVAGLIVQSLIVGDFGSAPLARSSSLLFFCVMAWTVWSRLKQARFGRIAAAMLEYSRCPHCGYDLRMLPADPADGATVCPECGCAWKLDGLRKADAAAAAVPVAPDPDCSRSGQEGSNGQ